jgi:predicted RNase H-like nuclease
MAVILGIDAAWTERGSSGIALLESTPEGRGKIIASAPSYVRFLKLTQDNAFCWERTMPRDVEPLDVTRTLCQARELAGAPVDLVAIDMPLSLTLIEKRRKSVDDAVSHAFGKYWAGVHSPIPGRPGDLSVKMTHDFQEAGYILATAAKPALGERRIVEVFPLAALVELLQLQGNEKRPPYKVGKRFRSETSPERSSHAERRKALLTVWRSITDALRREIENIDLVFQVPVHGEVRTFAELKPREDILDAILCAWAGLCVFQDRAKPFGDKMSDEGSIWVPLRSHLGNPRPKSFARG